MHLLSSLFRMNFVSFVDKSSHLILRSTDDLVLGRVG